MVRIGRELKESQDCTYTLKMRYYKNYIETRKCD
jgi:hypothetical protein